MKRKYNLSGMPFGEPYPDADLPVGDYLFFIDADGDAVIAFGPFKGCVLARDIAESKQHLSSVGVLYGSDVYTLKIRRMEDAPNVDTLFRAELERQVNRGS